MTNYPTPSMTKDDARRLRVAAAQLDCSGTALARGFTLHLLQRLEQGDAEALEIAQRSADSANAARQENGAKGGFTRHGTLRKD